MIARIAGAVCVVLVMCVVVVLLARRLRDVSLDRLLINLLFPFSQLCIVVFLFYCTIAY